MDWAKKEKSVFLKAPQRRVQLWQIVSLCAAMNWKITYINSKNPPFLPPHSAARQKSRHPSTLAVYTTTSPPPAARGWGEKHLAPSTQTHFHLFI